jgi:NAD(P)-dependent dehydrogenase (short-subunit alcohol dehydrogenase family)
MKNVFITGVGQGIGKALAQKYISEGFYVIGTTISGSSDYKHNNLKIIKLDLRDSESINLCEQNVRETGRNIDVFINNAGILVDDNQSVVIIDKLRTTLEVNLIGTIDINERLIDTVSQNGQIIFISSSAGSISRTGDAAAHSPNKYPAYKISKCAINMYMKTLSLREKDKFINSIHPGRVRTDLSGFDGDMSPEEAASEIYKFVSSNNETGYFWFEGGKMDW